MTNFQKYLDLSFILRDKPNASNLHFSYIIKKNRILSIGWNNSKKTHSLAAKHGYYENHIHSELAAVVKFPHRYYDLAQCTLINIRIQKDGNPMMSRPCKNCLKLLTAFQFKKVWYTGKDGQFLEL